MGYIRRPAYYKAFRCIGSDCTENCCIGWEIGIDPDTAAFYDSFPGETGDWLRSGITPPGTDRCFLSTSSVVFAGGDRLRARFNPHVVG